MALQCLSLDYTSAPARERSQFALIGRRRALFLEGRRAAGGCVLLSTCHRVELYFTGDRAQTEEAFFCAAGASSARFAYFPDGTEHLFLLAAGLLSMAAGEDEILHQLRVAYEEARGCGTDKTLNEAFQSALHCGRTVRAETGISSLACSVATLAANAVSRFLADGGTVLLVGGSGQIGNAVLANLRAKRKFTVLATERTHAFSAAQTGDGVRPVPYASRFDYLNEADAVVSCTASPHVVFPLRETAARFQTVKPRLFLDLAMPADVDEGVGELAGVTLVGIDGFRAEAEANSRRKQALLFEARAVAQRCLQAFRQRCEARGETR